MPEESGHAVEHRPVHAPTPAPLAAGATDEFVPDLAGDAALLSHPDIGGRGNAPVRAAAIQRMQQQYGNRATQRFLQRTPAGGVPVQPTPDGAVPVQRDNPPPAGSAAPAAAPGDKDKKPSTPITPAMFTVSGGQPTPSGAVHVNKKGDEIEVESPKVEFTAKVAVRDGVTLGDGDPVMVGPTQTLQGSTRKGIYRKGGAPDGEVVAEFNSNTGQTRDAVWSKATRKASFPAPWYSEPVTMNAKGDEVTTHFMDQPAFALPRTLGEGKLTETTGEDRFVTAVSAKRGGQIIHLQSSHWEVPWATRIDDANQQPGGEVTGGSTQNGPAVTDGPIAIAAGKDRMQFKTLDSAMGASPILLLDNLVPARSEDRESWVNIVEALRRKNVQFSVTVTVKKPASMGADDIRVTISGHQQIQRGTFNLDKGQSTTVTFSLLDLFDPGAMDASSTIRINAQDVGWKSHDALVMNWPYPFYDQPTEADMTGGDGSYKYQLTAKRG